MSATTSLSSPLREKIRKARSSRNGLREEQITSALQSVLEHPAWPAELPTTYRMRCSVVVMTGLLCTSYRPQGLPMLLSSARDACGASKMDELEVLETMRETALKCISFVGVPKIINCFASLMEEVRADGSMFESLNTESRRQIQPDNVADVISRGWEYWNAIYTPFADKLETKLAGYHPDLAAHILQCHYGALLAPVDPDQHRSFDLDRVLSSVLAVTCLRAQDGLEKQVESHVFGLKKAGPMCEDPVRWLTTDEGCMWLLDTVDELVAILAAPQ